MARTVTLVLALGMFVTACKGGDTDTDIGETGDTDSGDFHPLVPEKYKYLWNTDACEVEEGQPGIQIYKLVDLDYEDGAFATATGRFTATERWFWFHGGDWSNDCVDTWEIVGTFASFDYSLYGCQPCNEAYEITRTLVDRTCNYTYYTLFGYDPEEHDPPDEEVYEAMLMFDTMTPSDAPYIDNKMLVHNMPYTPDGVVRHLDYATTAHVFPRTEDSYGYPADYDWVGETCVGSGR